MRFEARESEDMRKFRERQRIEVATALDSPYNQQVLTDRKNYKTLLGTIVELGFTKLSWQQSLRYCCYRFLKKSKGEQKTQRLAEQ